MVFKVLIGYNLRAILFFSLALFFKALKQIFFTNFWKEVYHILLYISDSGIKIVKAGEYMKNLR